MNNKPSDATGIDAERLDPENIVAISLEKLMELDLWWGNGRLGLILSSAYFNQKPLSTAQLTELTGWSPETVRRHLKPLIAVDRVRVIEEGRNIRYKAREMWAKKTREILLKVHFEVEANRQQTEPLDLPRNWVFPKPLRTANLEITAAGNDGEMLDDGPRRNVG